MSIGVAISTRNRSVEFAKTIHSVYTYMPKDAKIFVVDDASYERYTESPFMSYIDYELYRFDIRQGIPRVKNKCFELMYNAGCSDMFLLDDDIIIKKHGWADAYINSGCAHLSYTFLHTIRRWKHFKFHRTSNGCALYYKRICLDTVGGMDTNYGLGTFDHSCLSRRIYNAKLTPYPYMDIQGSDQYFHSMDFHNEVERTLTPQEKNEQFKAHINYFNSKEKSKEYIEFRTNGSEK